MTSIADYAIVSQRVDVFWVFMSTVEYAPGHQLDDGSFGLVVSENLINSPDYVPPVPGNPESGTAFFASALGLSSLSLQNSDWLADSEETRCVRETMEQQGLAIGATLDYLMAGKDILVILQENTCLKHMP